MAGKREKKTDKVSTRSENSEPKSTCSSSNTNLDKTPVSHCCKKADCIVNFEEEVTCCIACQKKEPPNQKFSSKPWIQCDLCRKWWHLECTFLRIEDLKKIDKHKILFPCALCVLELSPWIKLKDTAETAKNTNQLHVHTQTDEIACTPAPEVILLEQTTKEPKGKTENKIRTNPLSSLNNKEQKPQKSEDISNSVDNVVIIDNIIRPQDYTDSRIIKREIKEKKDIHIKIAYRLPRGGIAIHTNSKEDRERL